MQRTFIFTQGKAVIYDKQSGGIVKKEFRITYSELNDTEEKIARRAAKVLGAPVIAVEDLHKVSELRIMSDEQFYELSELVKVEKE